jgi:hypothetical protein
LRGKARRIAPFVQWTRTEGIRLCEVDDLDACIEAFLACPSRRLYKHRCALQAFVVYLCEAKVLPQRPVQPSAAAILCPSVLENLHSQQGLSDHSIAAYAVSARDCIEAMQLAEEAVGVDALAIRRYILDVSQQHAVATVKVYAAGLRSFLRFCLLKGLINRDLSTTVPCIGRWQPKPMPPGPDRRGDCARAGDGRSLFCAWLSGVCHLATLGRFAPTSQRGPRAALRLKFLNKSDAISLSISGIRKKKRACWCCLHLDFLQQIEGALLGVVRGGDDVERRRIVKASRNPDGVENDAAECIQQ